MGHGSCIGTTCRALSHHPVEKMSFSVIGLIGCVNKLVFARPSKPGDFVGAVGKLLDLGAIRHSSRQICHIQMIPPALFRAKQQQVPGRRKFHIVIVQPTLRAILKKRHSSPTLGMKHHNFPLLECRIGSIEYNKRSRCRTGRGRTVHAGCQSIHSSRVQMRNQQRYVRNPAPRLSRSHKLVDIFRKIHSARSRKIGLPQHQVAAAGPVVDRIWQISRATTGDLQQMPLVQIVHPCISLPCECEFAGVVRPG